MSGMSRFTNQPYVGPGVDYQLARFPWYSTDVTNLTAAQVTNGLFGVPLGGVWTDANTGNSFQFVKATAALTAGQVVTWDAPTAGTVTAANSSVTAVPQYIGTNITTTVNEVGNYIYFIQTAESRLIKGQGLGADIATIKVPTGKTGVNAVFFPSLRSNSVPGNVADTDQMAAIPTNGTACCVIRPWNVIVCTASFQPVGVALGTVTINQYTIIQIAGYSHVASVGNGTALVVNTPAAPSAAGVIIGSAAANQMTAGVSILPQIANAAAGPINIPVLLNAIGG